MRRPVPPLLLGVILAAPAAFADSVFIIEQVVVNVVSSPDAESERVATVKSGDRLELIERQGDVSHVRLTNGTEGWIKSSYLSTDPPLAQRLSERTAEAEKLRQDVSRLEAELSAARAARAAAEQRSNTPAPPVPAPATPAAASRPSTSLREPAPAPAPAAAEAVSATAPATDQEPTPLLSAAQEPDRPTWEWVLGTAVIGLLAGFALGWRTLDRRIRHKYGGLRIY
ncbi:MAG TPA: TIGR04211 family SH3 domain-containing protein [Steroidobacteraceae bacterium]|nr:TIGR04211 family SH3 domain-containing protein [Steroidobacteraceae bacterium]